jgi:eukaryotic-like serine/threonine-protein kinase
MEYVASRSLAQVIKDDRTLTPRETAQVGIALVDALGAAHAAGVLHRDIKPGNVLLANDGRVMLTDFGLATFDEIGMALTQSGIVHGSPQFISPERALDGTSSPAADMWSLGATLYAAVEGRSPYSRPSSYEILSALATSDPDPMLNAGPLARVLNGLLRRDPAKRMKPEEMRARLERIVAEPERGRRRNNRTPDRLDQPSPRFAAGIAAVSLEPISGGDAARPPLDTPSPRHRGEPGVVEPGRAEPARIEPTRIESTRAESTRADSTRAEPTRIPPARVEPDRSPAQPYRLPHTPPDHSPAEAYRLARVVPEPASSEGAPRPPHVMRDSRPTDVHRQPPVVPDSRPTEVHRLPPIGTDRSPAEAYRPAPVMSDRSPAEDYRLPRIASDRRASRPYAQRTMMIAGVAIAVLVLSGLFAEKAFNGPAAQGPTITTLVVPSSTPASPASSLAPSTTDSGQSDPTGQANPPPRPPPGGGPGRGGPPASVEWRCRPTDPPGAPNVPIGATPSKASAPSGSIWYDHPGSYRIAVPKGWQWTTTGSNDCFYDPDSNDARLIGVYRTTATSSDPVAAFIDQQAETAGNQGLQGYRYGSTAAVPCAVKCAEWTYTYNGPGQIPIEVVVRVFLEPKQVEYMVTFASSEYSWASEQVAEADVMASFAPTH